MSLEEAVDLVLFAFENGQNGDILVRKAPACTIQTQAEAVIELFKHQFARNLNPETLKPETLNPETLKPRNPKFVSSASVMGRRCTRFC